MNLSLEERKIEGDLTFEFDNSLTVLIHEKDFEFFDHTQLDYVKDERGYGRFQLQSI